MDILFSLILSFAFLLFSAIQGYFIAYPLLLDLGIIGITLYRRGFSFNSLVVMGFLGSQKSFPVIQILLLIGAVTATWMAAGTVPAIVYYGIQFIHPHWFIWAAFVLTSLVSLLIGTSFGAVSTIGVALMIMARGSDVDSHIIAGAVIAGAYFGDRCSPMSSSAHLVATLTQTDLYTNLKNMIVTGLLPLVLTSLIYLICSLFYPVQITESQLLPELSRLFQLNWIVFLPAFTLFALAIFRVNVKGAMLISMTIGAILAVFVQHYSGLAVLQFAIAGFSLEQDTPIQSILLGGGILGMAKVCVVVVISTAIAGILAGTCTLQIVEDWLKPVRSRANLFLSTTLIGTVAAGLGCTQTIAILLTQQLVQQQYKERNQDNYKLALDLENTVVVIAPLIPWNIAGLVPATLLLTDWRFIPYAFYLYLIPLLMFVQLRLKTNSKY